MSPLRTRRPSVKKHMRGGLGAERAVHTRRTRQGEVVHTTKPDARRVRARNRRRAEIAKGSRRANR